MFVTYGLQEWVVLLLTLHVSVQGSADLAIGYHIVKADWFENGGGASMVSARSGSTRKCIGRLSHFPA